VKMTTVRIFYPRTKTSPWNTSVPGRGLPRGILLKKNFFFHFPSINPKGFLGRALLIYSFLKKIKVYFRFAFGRAKIKFLFLWNQNRGCATSAATTGRGNQFFVACNKKWKINLRGFVIRISAKSLPVLQTYWLP